MGFFGFTLPSKKLKDLLPIQPSRITFPQDTKPFDMKSLMTDIVRALVDYPEQVNITARRTPLCESYYIRVSCRDIGCVMGKKGAIIGAIRTLTNSIAGRGRVRTVVTLVR